MNNLNNLSAQEYKHHIGWMFYYLQREKPKVIVNLLNHQKGKGLDVGAGCGQYAKILKKWGYDMVAVEPNEKLINGYSGVKYICSGAEVPFKNKSFDFSYAINVLHHTYNPYMILMEMKRVSKKIIIGELNGDHPLVRLYIDLFMPFDSADDHYNEWDLRMKFESTGLKMIRFLKRPLLFIPDVFLWFLCE